MLSVGEDVGGLRYTDSLCRPLRWRKMESWTPPSPMNGAMNMKVGIIGRHGRRGNRALFAHAHELFVHDPAWNIPCDVIDHVDMAYIAVPTPPHPETGACDTTIVEGILGPPEGLHGRHQNAVVPGLATYHDTRFKIAYSPSFWWSGAAGILRTGHPGGGHPPRTWQNGVSTPRGSGRAAKEQVYGHPHKPSW